MTIHFRKKILGSPILLTYKRLIKVLRKLRKLRKNCTKILRSFENRAHLQKDGRQFSEIRRQQHSWKKRQVCGVAYAAFAETWHRFTARKDHLVGLPNVTISPPSTVYLRLRHPLETRATRSKLAHTVTVS